jgi:DNA anti-recombination protein RmuC
MEETEVSHKEIYDRLVKVESKVDKVATDTKGIVEAFHNAQGAFHVLEVLAKIAKPILWIVGVATAIVAIWNNKV